jgi:hypothetical protein
MSIIYDRDLKFAFNWCITEETLQASDSIDSNNSSLGRFNHKIRVIAADNPSADMACTVRIRIRIGAIESTGKSCRGRLLSNPFSTGEEVRMGRPSFMHGSVQDTDHSFMPDKDGHEQSYTWNEEKSNGTGPLRAG